ncbi:MAG TPA: DUF2282 domain-containing protein [Steroidobacteraceae bacterium]|jgi:uncharacterized membrane protein
MKKSNAAVTAIGTLLTLGAATFATVASAAGPVELKPGMEKCYGVVKAGKNDCAGPAHACSGQSKTEAGGKEFIIVPNGTCERLAGGSLMMAK